MSDMGWSRYIRDLDNAAYAQEQAEEQDMLPHLAKHCDYDSREYDKIEQMVDALSAIGLYVEDCTGDHSGIYEVSNGR
jgi:hypothetical protein